MTQSKPSPPELQPMTVGHGQKIFEQSRLIGAQIERLAPLLNLLQEPEFGTDGDPLQTIVQLLENLALQGQHQIAALQTIDAKLDALLGNSDIDEP